MPSMKRHASIWVALALTVCVAGVIPATAQAPRTTATPIKHLVILYSENVSFDHYFATYPQAANPPDEPVFTALPARRPSTTS